MNFHYSQIFLLVWIIGFWAYYFTTYGKVEEKHERTVSEKYGIRNKLGPLFGLAFVLWTVAIFIFFFHYNSINWIWKFSILDTMPVKVTAIVLLSAAFLLNILFTRSVGQSIQDAYKDGEEPKLITTGIFGTIRHPAYLAFFALAIGCFLLIPNLISLVLMIYTITVVYLHTLEEEAKLLKVYGDAYRQYMEKVGRYFPKLM